MRNANAVLKNRNLSYMPSMIQRFPNQRFDNFIFYFLFFIFLYFHTWLLDGLVGLDTLVYLVHIVPLVGLGGCDSQAREIDRVCAWWVSNCAGRWSVGVMDRSGWTGDWGLGG
ncbi:hypothetical protein L873DRAFT_1093783 [Choiromyces venosus 120613-1]|uniref:Uncharacterized protein n=1 Tax=Choiromyces venosus 120613-1 TaxID=1336337 RepID=A0A3N4JKQ5_9PEZI|nr:hypothetical protein L873DRAFT_1093783 [Choiromyces venosus 120613-1]